MERAFTKTIETESEANSALRKRAYVERLRSRPKRELPDLPVYYYLTHFDAMAEEVAEKYANCLDENTTEFLERYMALPDLARCLYARMAGRKGGIFDLAKFNYEEIDELYEQADLLSSQGFIRPLSAGDASALCHFLTKPELLDLMSAHLPMRRVKKGLAKPALAARASEEIVWAEALTALSEVRPHLIAQGYSDALNFCLFLYFGKVTDNLQSFTLRDLGLMRAPDLGESYSARFDNAESAQAGYFYSRALADFKARDKDPVERLIASLPNWPAPPDPFSENLRDKLLQKLGGFKEREKDIDTALLLYAQSGSPLCNEREIRLRWARNDEVRQDRDWVKARLESLLDDPGSDEEAVFASDFYARKFNAKRTSVMTDLLRGSTTIYLDEAFRNTPERAAMEKLSRDEGVTAFRTENEPWRAMFGLLFWDELFGEGASLYSSFDRLPESLRLGTFYGENSARIEDTLSTLCENPAAAQVNMLKTFGAHYGTVNGIFNWRPNMMERISPLLLKAPQGVAEMMRLMSQNWRGTKDGFPDLMLVKPDGVEFIEIKAEGDAIRRNQMTRIKQLRRAGIKTDIARVFWTVDPDQTYVVVDIETTGGRPPEHRITEIGAVKIQGGEIIDEWQSLINPERPVPPFITRLTGINDEMVAGAPIFAQIAEEFAAFMEGSVFVAHNVNFDYGFIADEYRRLDLWFRFPKLCTVGSMRRFYPGQKSYSLKNLCAAYEIDLDSHHRAMCDARAAAELLKMINAKRLAD